MNPSSIPPAPATTSLPAATSPIVRSDSVPPTEYARRRARVLAALSGARAAARPTQAPGRAVAGVGGSVGIVFAGEASAHASAPWRPNLDFLYLTGIQTESGAALVFDPGHPNPDRRIALFLRPLNPEADRWEGYRDGLGAGLRAAAGISFVARTPMLPGFLLAAAVRLKRLACLHALAPHTAEVSPDLAVFRRLAERLPGVTIDDRSSLLPSMRAVKSPAEVALMRRAAAATAAGFRAAARAIRPGVNESDVQRALEAAFVAHGAEGTAYGSIVGGGVNATVLHYERNNRPLAAGELVLIDAGARVGGYACDVTRVFPVGGRFTPAQRRVYQTVLDAERAGIRAARPGKHLWEVDRAARTVIDAAGHGDRFPHGTSHHLGLHVHDADPDAPLEPGMVVTVEPGVYIAEERIGIRIEDDALITRGAPEVLTSAIPKEPGDVERWMRGR